MEKTHIYNGQKMRVFDIFAFGHKEEVICVPNRYRSNDTLALEVLIYDKEYDGYEPFGMLTANLGDSTQSDTEAYVKTYSENSGWSLDLLEKLEAVQTGAAISGHCLFPRYKFDLSKCYCQ